MKLTLKILLLAVSLSLLPAVASAITNTAIAIVGPNLVLSWPSLGYESYLIQYRRTLNAEDAWSDLNYCYWANSITRTTFVIPGVTVPAKAQAGGGTLLKSATSGLAAGSGPSAFNLQPLALSAVGAAVPAALYPPNLLAGLEVYDPASGQILSGADYLAQTKNIGTLALLAQSGGMTPLGGPVLPKGGAGAGDPLPEPETGFYRVFHIPDWLMNVSAYSYDGPTFIPIDFADPDAPVSRVDNVTLLVNGRPMDQTVLMSYPIQGRTYWGLGIYFDRLPNGANTLQLVSSVRQTDTIGAGTPSMVFSNLPATVVINNLITATNWDDTIWNHTNYTFRLQCSQPSVDWQIDIYDVYNQYVTSQTGYSADGNIVWTWDLTDAWGYSRMDADADPYFYPEVTIQQRAGSPGGIQPLAAQTRNTAAIAQSYPSVGGWLIAYLDNYYSDGTTNYDATADNKLYHGGIDQIVGATQLWNPGNIPVLPYPIAYGRNYTQTQRNTSWDTLKKWLADGRYRNFYYHGHGGPNSIGGDCNVIGTNNSILRSMDLLGSTASLKAAEARQLTSANQGGVVPYRFVFLDGCDTANGRFAEAFGVPKEVTGPGWYFSPDNAKNLRPCAVVGWKTAIGASTDGSNGWNNVDKYWKFRIDWIGKWVNTITGMALIDALENAWKSSGWRADKREINDFLSIRGFDSMDYNQFNLEGDWPQ